MRDTKTKELKRSQKESLLKKELSKLFLEVKLNDPKFEGIFINKVQLSSDKSMVHVFFFTHEGYESFKELKPFLIMYKPSIRKALSQIIDARYTPEITFKYDKAFEKQCKIEQLLDKIKDEEQL